MIRAISVIHELQIFLHPEAECFACGKDLHGVRAALQHILEDIDVLVLSI